jgi:pimeloyl-ACP methyl ester carboxylesterase
VLLVELIFRRRVAPQICNIFENVPPFNVIADCEQNGAEQIRFRTEDGIELAGSLMNADLPDSPGVVLFLPELHGNHWMARKYCEALVNRGYVVLSFDFRNQGESGSMAGYDPIHWLTEYEMRDVAAALEFIESDNRLNTLPVVAFGVSRGGVAAILAGSRYPRIRAVVSDSAFGTRSMIRYFVDRFVQHVIPVWIFRLQPEWHIQSVLKRAVRMSEVRRNCEYVHLEDEVAGLEPDSVLLISGSRDSYVSPEIAARLQKIIGSAAKLWIAEGAKHNMSRSVLPDEYDRRVVNHVECCLRRDQHLTCDPVSSPVGNSAAAVFQSQPASGFEMDVHEWEPGSSFGRKARQTGSSTLSDDAFPPHE